MSTRDNLIKARLGMLALAEELQNISLACKRAGISRSHFYEIKDAFEKYGAEGLAPRPRRKPRMPNPNAAGAGAADSRDDRALSHASYLRKTRPSWRLLLVKRTNVSLTSTSQGYPVGIVMAYI